ncbi:MAG: sulfite exporter TauE/SafE family protein [Deltaproteobacteria bacterium]|nr:sulfite exporter TauE/SafE family protein [Deltaproteobacteria bacterium]MBW2530252.1 sulfite exporter TauE/SafE family protein [Deltaproteobacteria bacterium]
MDSSIGVIAATAAFLALTHTLIGVDHYLPFVALGRARRWSYRRLAIVVVLCGIGHVASSVLLGFVGIALGIAVGSLESVESTRGELASYLIIAFGLVYMLWGIRAALRNRTHAHEHTHADGSVHQHVHDHHGTHLHTHDSSRRSTVVWVLFLLFVFGPCEPLIPLIMYPAAKSSIAGVALVAGIFSVVTIAVMLVMSLALYAGALRLRWQRLERYTHAAAGFAILAAGLLVAFGGL